VVKKSIAIAGSATTDFLPWRCTESNRMATRSAQPGAGEVVGQPESELTRLERQAGVFADLTRDVLRRAGITEGMTVLDLGCGVGDVTMIASGLVGSGGQVVGVDISPAAVNIARARAEATDVVNAEFRVATIEGFAGYGACDAVVGRFIMTHLPDPAKTLRRITGQLKKGAIVAFCELDLSTARSVPAAPLLANTLERIAEGHRRAGADPDPGTRLFRTLRDAKLRAQMAGYTRIGDRTDLAGFEFLTEQVKAVLPTLIKLGIATSEDIGIATLRDRLVAEAETVDACVFYPRFIGAWARV